MQRYNPKDWFGLIFKFHKSDTFRKLFWVIVCVCIYSAIITYVELDLLNFSFESTVMHSLLGFVISLLLVFRTNTAYDRWWEGRKQWGALVNVCRNFGIKTRTLVKEQETQNQLIKLTQLYPFLLVEHLRSQNYDLLPEHIKASTDPSILNAAHAPNEAAMKMQGELSKASASLSDSTNLAMLQDLNQFTDICGACERIKKTPIPYNYNIFIKKFIFVYISTMPVGFAVSFGYWTILITAFTFYTLASLELIAESIEEPFGLDSDDLPTDELAETIYQNLAALKQHRS